MTELLKQYYKIKKQFESDEVKKKYADAREWSVEYNVAIDAVLCKMNKTELTHVLEQTTGPMRSVIAGYIKKASETAAVKDYHKKASGAKTACESRDAVPA